ncbi:MAG: GreA/GreB family elongation factor [Sphingomicrobium sp.]
MSVAFRRDCDEEHLEPKFELPIPPGPNLVTAHGYALIEERSAQLEGMLATELSEDERKAVLRDARYWRHQLASAQLVPVPDGATVAIGTRVTFECARRTRTLDIVGHDESDPAANRVAFSAPLARALIGCAIGDEADLPGAADPVTINAIEVPKP